jgi:NAD(P)-dependent dehydrogenase (short-subunit alcohol dehydrogenase family)
MLLRDKIVLVTGASGAVGSAIVKAVREHGGVPFGTDLKAGAGVDAVHDVTSEESWQDLCAEVERRHGRLDGLVNNAGVVHFGNVEVTELADFRRVMAVNVEGVFLGCKIAWPLLRKSTAASIVNVSSTAGLAGNADYTAYTASKGAVRIMSKTIALHGARFDPVIRCNSLHPSLMAGNMADIIVAAANDAALTPEKIAATRNPMRRLALTSETASAAVFLLSGLSSFVTGSELVSDGGQTAI